MKLYFLLYFLETNAIAKLFWWDTIGNSFI